MMMINNSLISHNYISSQKNDIEFRGDGLKIWYSNNNIITDNTIDGVRDTTLTYSHNNIIKNNTFLNNRFALHISKSHHNRFEKNIFKYNSVGIMLMMSKDTKIIKNRIFSSTGAVGMGVLFKDSSNVLFKNNSLKYNAVALYIDTKHTEKGMQRKIINNTFAYNKVAFDFHAAIKNNTIVENNIFANIEDVVKSARSNVTYLNIIEKNYWDRYSGFDRNSDNIGDRPYKIYQYADQLWHYNHKIKFFYASPLLTLLNFLANLAPFVEPVLILEDKKPLMRPLTSSSVKSF
jgi:nitrous oxidase accessory protein